VANGEDENAIGPVFVDQGRDENLCKPLISLIIPESFTSFLDWAERPSLQSRRRAKKPRTFPEKLPVWCAPNRSTSLAASEWPQKNTERMKCEDSLEGL
jgi:hypothetical protein